MVFRTLRALNSLRQGHTNDKQMTVNHNRQLNRWTKCSLLGLERAGTHRHTCSTFGIATDVRLFSICFNTICLLLVFSDAQSSNSLAVSQYCSLRLLQVIRTRNSNWEWGKPRCAHFICKILVSTNDQCQLKCVNCSRRKKIGFLHRHHQRNACRNSHDAVLSQSMPSDDTSCCCNG